MFIDPEHLLSSITSASQLNRSMDYTHIPHPHQKHSTRTPHDMLNRTRIHHARTFLDVRRARRAARVVGREVELESKFEVVESVSKRKS